MRVCPLGKCISGGEYCGAITVERVVSPRPGEVGAVSYKPRKSTPQYLDRQQYMCHIAFVCSGCVM